MKLLIVLCLATAVIGCGIRLRKPHSRHARAIIGGKNVNNPKKWPWQVLLITEKEEQNYMQCGGTVIGKQWVLTAAHCVTNSTSSGVSVYDGLTHIEDRKYAREVIETVIHPYYDADLKVNDIAVLKLAEPLVFDHLVAPICLPNPSQSIPDDGQAVITGFGDSDFVINGTKVVDNDGQFREAIVPIINTEVCFELYNGANPTEENIEEEGDAVTSTEESVENETVEEEIDERKALKIVCASSYAHGTHSGDSGGPLMMRESSGRWFQIGITSFIKCETDNCEGPGDGIRGDLFPKAFTDVRPYCEWIAENTEGEVNCYKREVLLEDVDIKA